jgi:hypothetical protein
MQLPFICCWLFGLVCTTFSKNSTLCFFAKVTLGFALIVLKMLSAFACIASMSSYRVSAAAAIVVVTVVGVVTGFSMRGWERLRFAFPRCPARRGSV